MTKPFKTLPLHRNATAMGRALKRLGIQTADVWSKPKITPHIDELRLLLQTISYNSQQDLNLPPSIIDILQASDDPDAAKVLAKYYTVPESYRSPLPIEAFCVAAGVEPLKILEVIVATIVRLNHHLSQAIAHVAEPRVVTKLVEVALKDDGDKARETLLKSTGFIPTPRGGPSVRVNVQQAQTQTAAVANAAPAPRPEDTIERLVNRFNDARPGPQAPPMQVIDVRPVDSDEDEDES